MIARKFGVRTIFRCFTDVACQVVVELRRAHVMVLFVRISSV